MLCTDKKISSKLYFDCALKRKQSLRRNLFFLKRIVAFPECSVLKLSLVKKRTEGLYSKSVKTTKLIDFKSF